MRLASTFSLTDGGVLCRVVFRLIAGVASVADCWNEVDMANEKTMSEGTVETTHEVKYSKTVIDGGQESDTTGLVSASAETVDRVEWSGGRTVGLAPFEFARLDISVGCNGGEDQLPALQKAVNAMLTAEVRALKETKLERPDLSFLDPLTGVTFRINYGLTFSLPNYESYRFDVAVKQGRSDGASTNELIASVQAIVASKVKEQVEAVNKRRGK